MIFVNLPCNKIFSDHPSRKVSKKNRCSFYVANGSYMRKKPCRSCEFWAQFSINPEKWCHRTQILERCLQTHFTCRYLPMRRRSCEFLSSAKIIFQFPIGLRIHKKCRTDLWNCIELFSFSYHLPGQKSYNTTQVLLFTQIWFFQQDCSFFGISLR